MSELAGGSGGMQAGGDLKLDLFDVSYRGKANTFKQQD